MPGSRISTRLAIFALGFVGLLICIAVFGPRLHLWHHDSTPEVDTKELNAPISQPAIKANPYHPPAL
jgi:hypothetical protein